ncbi:MAG TPA: substrate-binding domain-containing protein [Euzebyales bacterium]
MWPKAGVAVLILLTGMALGVGLGNVITGDEPTPKDEPSEVAADCDAGNETIDIAADDAVVPIVRELADGYTADLRASGRDCIPIRVRPVSSSAVVGRLINGWRSDTHGPRPDVWIPQSTLWTELARLQLDDPTILPDDPTVLARSPTVLAVPRPMAEELGWPDERLNWKQFFDLADSDAGWSEYGKREWGSFRLEMTDPRYTTTGLQALLALDAANGGSRSQSATPLSLFRVQRVLSNIDASSVETLERYASADAPLSALSATPLEEREVWRFNQSGAPAPDEPSESSVSPPSASSELPELVAMYPDSGRDDIAMESNYPYVLLNTSWVSNDVLQVADEFGDYLLSDAGVKMFTDAGFRTRDNEASDVLRDEDCMRAMDQIAAEPPGDLPDVDSFRKLRSSWVTVPRFSRTLFLVDVSGSMNVLVADGRKTRLEATVRAAQRSLDVIPNGSDVGLWEFSTDLPGGQHGGDYRELAAPGPLNEIVDGRQRKRVIVDELDALDPENDTALNDTVVAAYRSMRRRYEPGSQHTIVLLTDGRNDDDNSIGHEQMLRRLQSMGKPGQPIDVVSIAYGEGPDLDKLADISEVVGGRVISSPQVARLDRLFIEALRR